MAGSALVALLAAAVIDRLAPFPAADVGRGSEEAFASGLQQREIPPRQGPQRWTTDRAVILFRDVPAGPGTLEVRLRGNRGPVTVAVNGAVVGSVEVGTGGADFGQIGRAHV